MQVKGAKSARQAPWKQQLPGPQVATQSPPTSAEQQGQPAVPPAAQVPSAATQASVEAPLQRPPEQQFPGLHSSTQRLPGWASQQGQLAVPGAAQVPSAATQMEVVSVSMQVPPEQQRNEPQPSTQTLPTLPKGRQQGQPAVPPTAQLPSPAVQAAPGALGTHVPSRQHWLGREHAGRPLEVQTPPWQVSPVVQTPASQAVPSGWVG
jgi:hypothetical protein